MIAVIFEVWPKEEAGEAYLEIAGKIRELLTGQEGFISIERFKSLEDEGKMLSLSFWESEEAIEKWRNVVEHRQGQLMGKEQFFNGYHLRVAQVSRDYTHEEREQAPADSNAALGK